MKSSVVCAFVLLATFAVGCNSTSPGASASGGTPGTDGGANGGATESALTCVGVFDCAVKCPDNDDPCSDGCLAKGTPDAKASVDAIVACYTQFNCEDEACFSENCSATLDACVKPVAGKSFTGDAPAGNVPAGLVGKWYSHGELWEFEVDGSVSHGSSVDTSGCATGSLESGTAVAGDDTLTIYFTTGGVSVCGGSSSEPYTANTQEFTYRLSTYQLDDGPHEKLSLTDVACVAKANGNDFYCINGFDKQ